MIKLTLALKKMENKQLITKLNKRFGNHINLIELLSNLTKNGFTFKLDQNNTLNLYCHKLKQSLSVDFTSQAIQDKINPNKAKPAILKAIEGRKQETLNVLDGTTGLGSDAFTIASRGHHVTAVEQSITIFLLLADALSRAEKINDLEHITNNITIIHQNIENFLSLSNEFYDVIYLDPMFPKREKSAKVKKNMQVLHEFLGFSQLDESDLFRQAKNKCHKLVVKRAIRNLYFANEKPSTSLKGKANRFDIYQFT